jgi:hypothetical protein
MKKHLHLCELAGRDETMVGGGTHPDSGLPTIYESARISANLIDKYEL